MGPQICSNKKYLSYWIYYTINHLQQSQIFVGIGTIPGLKCIAKLDDSSSDSLSEHNDSSSSGCMYYYAGFGNSMLHKYNNMGHKHKNNESQYVHIRRLYAFSASLSPSTTIEVEEVLISYEDTINKKQPLEKEENNNKNKTVLTEELIQEYN